MQIPRYISLREKEAAYGGRYLRVNTIEDFEDWYKDNKLRSTTRRLYRGVNDASYKNYSSAQRFYIEHDLHGSMDEILKSHINRLKELDWGKLESYCDSLGVPCTDLYLMSFAQHYNGISPLVDFSSAAPIALYFMMKGATPLDVSSYSNLSEYTSIYYVGRNGHRNLMSYENVIHSRWHKYYERFDNGEKINYTKLRAEIIDDCLDLYSYDSIKKSSNDKPMLIPYAESREIWIRPEAHFSIPLTFSNFNLISQHGNFVFNSSMRPLDEYIYCVDIHKSLLKYIRRKYMKNHYTKRSLFPSEKDIVRRAKEHLLS